MRRLVFSVIHSVSITVLALGVSSVLCGCKHRENSGSPILSQARESDRDSTVEGAELDRRLTDTYLRHDSTALADLVAPDYYGTGEGFEWDFAALQREFPKIHLSELHLERQRVKRLAPHLVLVNDFVTMREIYGDQDISGRYWSSDIWVQRNGRWLLLVEQEVPLK
ncbi:MAG TPA: nuclear transport factor 2 family protein [Verrucomicrobiae bacterium]|nr:nuclear transport factor 2 family protein [Verrucomicrobiae bacterium]